MCRVVEKISVRNLIEFVLRSGSIESTIGLAARALEGTIAHQKVQENNKEIYKEYEKEVFLTLEYNFEEFHLIIEGRADGIIKDGDDITIEEIKSTRQPIYYIEEDFNILHWYQVKFYGYMYCVKNNLSKVKLRLTYYHLDDKEVKSFEKEYDKKVLEDECSELIDRYKGWIELRASLRNELLSSTKNLKFPFSTYRKGQRELAIHCYNTIRDKGVFFVEAPTGIGKTMSTLFPAIKALGEGMAQRVFYLTSKTITGSVARNSISILRGEGFKGKVISISAKEKNCINDKVACNPEECPYAKDYYTKINDILYEVIQKYEDFSQDTLIKIGREYGVCPFELSLDLSLYCNLIICDYNYAFDPRAALKRFFEEEIGKNILLIDEGHNLLPRAREMFSEIIDKSKFLNLSKSYKGKIHNLYKGLKSINDELIKYRHEAEFIGKNQFYIREISKDLVKKLRNFIVICDEYLSRDIENKDELLDVYFNVRSFISLCERFREDDYALIVSIKGSEVSLKIFCANPREDIKGIIEKSYSTIIFSATLSPMNYYIDTLGGDEKSYRAAIASPFNSNKLKVYKKGINLRYQRRDGNIDRIIEEIYKFKEEERGNYIVFFPSYEFMNKVKEEYNLKYNEKILLQDRDLSEVDKEEFLSEFKEDSEVLAFCVIGGMFSEGIDLPGRRLIGSIIIGVGFPKISIEGDIIVDTFKEEGFNYAYIYPGIAKIRQAVGRVIRSEQDEGRVLLIDDRYFTNQYRRLLPKEWY